ncbi:MAG: winged helix-turn-helix transcriptional regulator [Ketobacter sp.]|nr:winged helix-turn-helix transcriptional regulator [Planctomycetota bacterium]MCP5015653.1 winged helix-turn-helix transcriptional regulator [Ketobacter sp.]
MDTSTAVVNLAALAQESRLDIFRLLVQQGPKGLCVSDIGEHIEIAAATLSFHLKELSSAGLITSRKDGRHIYYSPDFTVMDSLINFLTENCCSGIPCNSIVAPKKQVARKAK